MCSYYGAVAAVVNSASANDLIESFQCEKNNQPASHNHPDPDPNPNPITIVFCALVDIFFFIQLETRETLAV